MFVGSEAKLSMLERCLKLLADWWDQNSIFPIHTKPGYEFAGCRKGTISQAEPLISADRTLVENLVAVDQARDM